MAIIRNAFYGIVLLAFTVGNIWHPQMGLFSFPIIDICLLALSLYLLFENRRFLLNQRLLIAFIGLSLINLIFHSLPNFVFTPFLYWLRFSVWFMAMFLPAKPLFSTRFFLSILFFFLIVGFGQYFLFPNLQPLTSANWDPHLSRLTGTLLDPAFTGICLLLFLIYLLTQSQNQLTKLLSVITYLALALTYSRASILALIIWALYYALKHHRTSFFIKTALVVVLTLFLLPRPPGEGTKLERTSTIKAKIINYQQAISLYSQHPLFGIGYNRIGFYRPQEKSSSHARWGFDNSFLNIGIGNGLLLWLAFLILSSQLWVKSLKLQDFLLPAFICSLFSNALLYSYVMFLLLAFKYRKL